MVTSGHFGSDDNVNYRTRPRYLDQYACVKFEERSLNPYCDTAADATVLLTKTQYSRKLAFLGNI